MKLDQVNYIPSGDGYARAYWTRAPPGKTWWC